MSAFQDDEVFGGTSSQYLSTRSSPRKPVSAPRKSASRQSIRDVADGRHSLAHELAAALMPEPTVGSKLLAEEFGIEYDEGAEGIDQQDAQQTDHVQENGFPTDDVVTGDPVFGDSSSAAPPDPHSEQDAMQILSQNLAFTDNFILHLRRLDGGMGSATATGLEKSASDMISRINEATRDREGQVRELLECEREFRKIAGEVGGDDVLGQLEELDGISPSDPTLMNGSAMDLQQLRNASHGVPLTPVKEWDREMDSDVQGYEDELYSESGSPTKESFPPPSSTKGSSAPANVIPHLADLRTYTTSLASSLARISEQAQVNGAATTEAGRKIRALKNKLGGWRMEWDGAEQSRLRIERWEAGVVDDISSRGLSGSTSRQPRRIDGRKIVEEHLQAFEKALSEASLRSRAITAAA